MPKDDRSAVRQRDESRFYRPNSSWPPASSPPAQWQRDLLRSYLAPTNLAMLYLLGVVAIGMRFSRRVSVVSSFVAVAAFDFFCVPPYLTFAVADSEYLVTFTGCWWSRW